MQRLLVQSCFKNYSQNVTYKYINNKTSLLLYSSPYQDTVPYRGEKCNYIFLIMSNPHFANLFLMKNDEFFSVLDTSHTMFGRLTLKKEH